MFVTARQTGDRKPMDINIFSSSYLQRGNCAKQRAKRRRGGWRLKERIARSHLNNKWGEMSHFHFISTLNIFVSDCNGDGCEWWPARKCWALLHLVDTKGFSPISFDWGPFNMLRNISVTAKAWILDDICKVFAPIAAPCTAITSPPCVFCIALSIVCLHWMDLCTLVKVINIFSIIYLATQWFLLCFLSKIFSLNWFC